MRHSYLEQLGRFIAKAPLEGAACAIGLDVMHGATGDLLVSLLTERGFRVTLLHGKENPGFGGICPNPIAAHLQDLTTLIAAGDVSLGLAFDGDGDRLSAIDEEGEFLGPQELFPLLLHHLLVRRKERGQVIKSASTTQMIDRICAAYDLPLTEVAVGFKHACQAILDDQVLIAGEESGAPGIPRHLPDRDGQMAALLLLEALGCEKLPLCELRRNLQQQFGPLYYRQRNLELPGISVQALRHHLERLAPARIGSLQVRETSHVDGVKWRLEHDAWLLLRLSGTEPLVRLYAEASEAQTAEDLLDCGQSLFTNAARNG